MSDPARERLDAAIDGNWSAPVAVEETGFWAKWRSVFTRLSAQINAVQIIVLTALQFVPLPMSAVLTILTVLAACALGAARVKQKSVRTYDPRKFRLEPIDPHGDVNE